MHVKHRHVVVRISRIAPTIRAVACSAKCKSQKFRGLLIAFGSLLTGVPRERQLLIWSQRRWGPLLQFFTRLGEQRDDTAVLGELMKITDYTEQVRLLFPSRRCVESPFSPADQKLAAGFFRQQVRLEEIETALLVGCARKYVPCSMEAPRGCFVRPGPAIALRMSIY